MSNTDIVGVDQGEHDDRVDQGADTKGEMEEVNSPNNKNVVEEAVKSDNAVSDEAVLEKLKTLVTLLRRQRELLNPEVSEEDNDLDSGKAPVIDLTLADDTESTSRPESGPSLSAPLDSGQNLSDAPPNKKRKVDEAASADPIPHRLLVDMGQMQHLLASFLSGCFSFKNGTSILHVNAVLSVPAIKTLLLSQKLLLRPFHFNIPRINFHQLKGYKDILEGSLCFTELIFLMILVNLPSIQSFDLVQEMLCTHLNFCTYLDTSRLMHSSPDGHVTCSFFWSTRGKHPFIHCASTSIQLYYILGLHFLDIPFNLQFHGILRTQIQNGRVIRAQILFDPTVLIRQCDCISQYYKSTAFPIAFGMLH